MKAKERIWLTADRTKVVPEGHTAAAFLWAAPGDEIPGEAAERFGVVDGLTPVSGKAQRKGADKGGKPEDDKAGKPDGDKSGQPGGDQAAERRAALLAAIAGLRPGHAEDFTEGGKGKPSVAALEAVLKFDITASERDAAWDEWQAENDSAEGAAGAKPPADKSGGLRVETRAKEG